MITIAFSNPSVGYNKLGVGTNGSTVWDNMGSPYDSTVERIVLNDNTALVFTLQCTSGETSTADVFINRVT